MNFFFKIIIAVVVLGMIANIAVLAALYFFQEKIIFYPQASTRETFEFPAPFEERWIDFNGTKVSSLLFRSSPSKGVVAYFHGNAGNLESWGYAALELSLKTGFDVWIFDYPGFGKSEGKISSQKQLTDLARVFWTEVEKEYPTQKKLIFGRSIGSGIAVQLASSVKADGLILESAYASIGELAKSRFPLIPLFVLRYPLKSDDMIGKIDFPILMVHGTEDEIIPLASGRLLAASAKHAEFSAITNAHHNDLSEYPGYWKVLTKWLEKF